MDIVEYIKYESSSPLILERGGGSSDSYGALGSDSKAGMALSAVALIGGFALLGPIGLLAGAAFAGGLNVVSGKLVKAFNKWSDKEKDKLKEKIAKSKEKRAADKAKAKEESDKRLAQTMATQAMMSGSQKSINKIKDPEMKKIVQDQVDKNKAAMTDKDGRLLPPDQMAGRYKELYGQMPEDDMDPKLKDVMTSVKKDDKAMEKYNKLLTQRCVDSLNGKTPDDISKDMDKTAKESKEMVKKTEAKDDGERTEELTIKGDDGKDIKYIHHIGDRGGQYITPSDDPDQKIYGDQMKDILSRAKKKNESLADYIYRNML